MIARVLELGDFRKSIGTDIDIDIEQDAGHGGIDLFAAVQCAGRFSENCGRGMPLPFRTPKRRRFAVHGWYEGAASTTTGSPC